MPGVGAVRGMEGPFGERHRRAQATAGALAVV